MPVVGSRFLIEAGFIIAVAVVAGIERLSTWWIIAVVAAAWIVVAIVEIVLWTRQVAARQIGTGAAAEPGLAAPSSTPSAAGRPEPVPERRPEPEPETRPVAPLEPVPETARVLAFTPVNDAPREWNLWELERAARDHVDDDVAQAEERSYLLMYLRDFAGPDGVLPADFDGLVRDAFGDVLHSVGA